MERDEVAVAVNGIDTRIDRVREASDGAGAAVALWEDELFQDVAQGAKILPPMLLKAILAYQRVIYGDGWSTLQDVRASMERLETGHEQMEDAIMNMLGWDGPQHLKRACGALDDVMTTSEDGPIEWFKRMRDDLEEAEEENENNHIRGTDQFLELLGDRIDAAKDGCNMILAVIRRLNDAEERLTKKMVSFC